MHLHMYTHQQKQSNTNAHAYDYIRSNRFIHSDILCLFISIKVWKNVTWK